MRIIIIDNYDSFVYNIAQYAGSLGAQCEVMRNDRVSSNIIRKAGYDGIIISPGPGTPSDTRYFGVCSSIIRELGEQTPILGVCLGHQGIIEEYGGRIVNAERVRHGKTSLVVHDGSGVFSGLPTPIRATRYHSLVGQKSNIPTCLRVNATAQDDGEVMGVCHRSHPVTGVQFHPESIMTQYGMDILANFLQEVRR